MKATVDAQVLAAAMKHSAAQVKGVLPILRMARITASENGLLIETTDLEASVSVEINAQVEDSDGICLHAGALGRVLQGVTGPVCIHDKGIDGPDGKCWGMPALPVADYPAPDKVSESTALDLPDFGEIIKRVAYAAPSGDVRYYLNGMHIVKGGVTATDGTRLAWVPVGYDKKESITIPVKQLRRLQAVVEADDDIEVLVLSRLSGDGPSALRVRAGSLSFTTNLIDCQTLPHFEEMTVSNNPDFAIDVSVAELKNTCARACLLGAVWDQKITVLKLQTVDGSLLVEGKDFRESISTENLEGGGHIHVQGPLLSAALTVVKSDTVTLLSLGGKLLIQDGADTHLMVRVKV